MAVNTNRNNGAAAFRNRVARGVFSAADSLGISDRDLVERLAEQVIQRLEETCQSFPGMEGAIPEWRLSYPEIQAIIKQIMSEGSEMEVTIHHTESQPQEQITETQETTHVKEAQEKKTPVIESELQPLSKKEMVVMERR